MNGLRLRRRDRSFQQSIEYTDDQHVKSSTTKSYIPRFSLMLNFIQLILLIYLFQKLSTNPTTTSSDVTTFSNPQSSILNRNSTSSNSFSLPPLLSHYHCYVVIYAYDRPRQLLHLLQDLEREANSANITIGVSVVDDGSLGCVFPPANENIFDLFGTGSPTATLHSPEAAESCSARSRFRLVEQFLQAHQWRLLVAPYRHARRRYWHLIRMTHASLHPVSADHYLFLPDDDRLSHGFFSNVFAHWQAIKDPRKLSLMLHVEESRENVPVWTNLRPRPVADGVSRIGWVESGNFLCTEDLLRFMNYSFPRVPIDRWIRNPPISSGVGATLSELIHGANKRMYRTDKSYVAHVGVTLSKMNAQFREKGSRSLLTKYFADGDDAYEKLLKEAATVTASIASSWVRESTLHSAVDSLAHQVDHLNIYLNGYDAVPSYLLAPYITAVRSQEKHAKGDIGDIGKFFFCNDLDTEFHLTADDDIMYPSDYVAKLVNFSQSFHPPVVVGVHGISIKEESLTPSTGGKGKGYYGSREVWMAVEKIEESVNVHIIGTGTMMYRPADVGEMDLDVIFPEPNMADIWFGILAQKQKIPMVVIPHHADWIKEVPGTFEDSIYKRSTKSSTSGRKQTIAAKSASPWILNKPTNWDT